MRGRVKTFNSVKGFGFLVPEDHSPDVFVHQTAIEMDGYRSLVVGEEVEFEVGFDNQGRTRATKVIPLTSRGPYR